MIPGKTTLMLDPSHSYSCPYCGKEQQVLLEPFAGRVQKFVTDCPTGTIPILLKKINQWDVKFAVGRFKLKSALKGKTSSVSQPMLNPSPA